MRHKYLLFLVLLFFLITVGSFFVRSQIRSPVEVSDLWTDKSTVDYDGIRDTRTSGNRRGIAISGMTEMFLVADQSAQRVNIFNDSYNDCLMSFTLYADDRELWHNDGYAAPGQAYYDISIIPLSAGQYDGALFVQCFTQNGSALNNAMVEFPIYVS